MEIFTSISDLRIGKVIEVNGTSIKIEIDPNLNDLTHSYNGRVYSIGQMASIIKIHFGRKILFAYVRMLRMSNEINLENIQNVKVVQSDDSRILEADLFGQGLWDSANNYLQFSRGVEIYPLPLQSVYLMSNEELDKLYEGAENLHDKKNNNHIIPIGSYVGSNQKCRANINKLFGHHCAILGSTGSGKSGTVAALIHSILNHKLPEDKTLNPRIIIIDPHGEYGKAFKDSSIIYKAYSEASNSTSDLNELLLPYWLMTGDEFRSLIIGKTEYEATTQNNIVYDALSYARMVKNGIVKTLGSDPDGASTLEMCEGIDERRKFNFDRDKPLPFYLSDFINHIDKVQGRKPGKKEELAQSAGRDKIDGILKKIRVLQSNPQLNFLLSELNDNTPKISEIIMQLIGEVKDKANKNLRIIDISGLPNEIAGILTAIIARLLFQYKLWQNRPERENDPILLVCEEAHRYVPNIGEAQYKEAQTAIRRIAKEGRKYGIGIMLVSQRPSDVESTVLSQCNSWIILRLTNSSDQNHVSTFLPDSLTGLTRILSSLTRREAIFVGEAAALPSRIRILELNNDQLPDSSDIEFIKGWCNKLASAEEIKKITDKWTKF